MAVLWESDRIHAIISRFVHVDLKKRNWVLYQYCPLLKLSYLPAFMKSN